MPELFSPAVSEDYAELILRNRLFPGMPFPQSDIYFFQSVDNQYNILYTPLSEWKSALSEISYYSIPKLFTYTNTVSLEASGILNARIQPNLQLQGKGILIGFIDSGIDYTHPAFRNPDGTTKILRLWDQTDLSGPAPEGIPYGTEYTEAQINEALFSGSPMELIPENDTDGHGTAAAGIACGSPSTDSDFSGAAPLSSIVFVKLRPAKQYLRDYFLIPEQASAFQETDLMLGVRFLVDTARSLAMPLVICICLGTNQGGHSGDTPLENVLSSAQINTGIYGVAGTGNEAGQGHHYAGQISQVHDYDEVELLINENTEGFTIEFWADSPELYSIGFTSPAGETIEPVQPRLGAAFTFRFLLDYTQIQLDYFTLESLSGAQLIQIRFRTPSPGLWRMRIVNLSFVNGVFHMWLPVTGLISPDVRFYSPDVNTTLVIPSCTEAIISCSTYNAFNNSLYIRSGRGYTRNGLIKPDFASPGVNLTAPSPGGDYQSFTGSSAASAITAGAAALLVESGLQRSVPRYYTSRELRNLFIRGARRNPAYSYPNREWGYGTMDVYGVFESLIRS